MTRRVGDVGRLRASQPDGMTSSVSVQGTYLAGATALRWTAVAVGAGESLCSVVAVTSAVTVPSTIASAVTTYLHRVPAGHRPGVIAYADPVDVSGQRTR